MRWFHGFNKTNDSICILIINIIITIINCAFEDDRIKFEMMLDYLERFGFKVVC